MNAFEPNIAFTIFILTLVMDALHAIYTRAVAANRAGRAATFGSLIYLISGFAVIHYTQNHLYLLCVVAGSWVGTYLSIKVPLTWRRSQKSATDGHKP